MKRRSRKWAGPRWSRWDLGVSFSISTTMACPIFLWRMGILKMLSSACRSAWICRAFAFVSEFGGREISGSNGADGAGVCRAASGAGRAYADIDNDGFLDVLVTTNGGPAYLFHNEGGTNHSLRVKLVGTKSNRDGIGAVVHVTSGADKQTKMLRSGSSYLSASELVLTFGLGTHAQADAVEVDWPSGQIDRLAKVGAGETVTVQEGKGIVALRAYGSTGKRSQLASARR